jgi:four helix bundle protein
MIQNFRTYELAVSFYRRLPAIEAPAHLKDQLLRAGSSIILNLAEGSAKPTKRDQRRFYAMAFGSIREVQAIADILNLNADLTNQLDHLAACTYKLVYRQ